MGLSQSLIVYFSLVILSGCVNTSRTPVDRDMAVKNYLSLAKGYLQEGYSEKALKPLNRALEIDSGSADVYGMLGLLYQVQGEAVRAEKAFKLALSYDADAADVQNNYGAYLFSQGRLGEAYQQFVKAAENVDYEHRSRAFENMGIVAQRQDRLDLAQQHFEKALRLNGNLSRARLELATILHKQKKHRSAWLHYLAFTKLSSQTSRSLWLGVQLARQNGDKDAVASYGLQLERFYPRSKESEVYRSRVGHEY